MVILSQHDQKTLNSVLHSGINTYQPQIDSSLPPDSHVLDLELLEEFNAKEKSAVILEKNNNSGRALEILNDIIRAAPNYASAYNNRAQLKRSMRPLEACPIGVMEDLKMAIDLCLLSSENGIVSKMQAGVLRNAYGQLAAVFIAQSKLPENRRQAWNLQTKASNMMVEAGKYGERIAASVAASVNPYSKLCGSMVETVLKSDRVN